MKGRAETSDEKRAALDIIYVAWLAQPELRLGQLIVNACAQDSLFYVEDEDLAQNIGAFAQKALSVKRWEVGADVVALLDGTPVQVRLTKAPFQSSCDYDDCWRGLVDFEDGDPPREVRIAGPSARAPGKVLA